MAVDACEVDGDGEKKKLGMIVQRCERRHVWGCVHGMARGPLGLTASSSSSIEVAILPKVQSRVMPSVPPIDEDPPLSRRPSTWPEPSAHSTRQPAATMDSITCAVA